jgi:hypothetical protein
MSSPVIRTSDVLFQVLTTHPSTHLHSLKTITNDGRIRLSEDDGPPAHEFLEGDYDEDNMHLDDSDDELLSEHVRKATQAWRGPNYTEEGQQIRVLDTTRTPH